MSALRRTQGMIAAYAVVLCVYIAQVAETCSKCHTPTVYFFDMLSNIAWLVFHQSVASLRWLNKLYLTHFWWWLGICLAILVSRHGVYSVYIACCGYVSCVSSWSPFFYNQTINYHICWYAGPWFNIKMSSYQYWKSHCGDKTILRPSYLHNGISYTGKTTSLYRISSLASSTAPSLPWINILRPRI